MSMLNMHEIVGTHDIVMLSLDTLRFDAARREWQAGRLPVLASVMPSMGFERRHTPASFTYAAHRAFFAGFLPTPATPGPHPRLFALDFSGSESTSAETYVFHGAATIVQGLQALSYQTVCIGGVGFFNLQNPLGCELPNLFAERYWRTEFGVTEPRSTEHQVQFACERLAAITQPVFMFINISALHQPNRHYMSESARPERDNFESHCAALRYVDSALAPLFAALRQRKPSAGRSLVLVLSDHGTAYGEDGFYGHRHAHPVVMEVPYQHFLLASGDQR
jgi:Sulfatase